MDREQQKFALQISAWINILEAVLGEVQQVKYAIERSSRITAGEKKMVQDLCQLAEDVRNTAEHIRLEASRIHFNQMAQNQFKLAPRDTAPYGTSLKGYFSANFADLVQHFGQPNDDYIDCFKTSTQWVFVDDDGAIVTLYDYKATSLYGRELPSVEKFRDLPVYEWHIGASSVEVAVRFVKWLRELGIKEGGGGNK